ncbi:hypothetical protein VDIAB_110497 [Vibrio diabolicus]|nr:hypothetical protein VDIAB_110497 [Vibrio diabolicus]
MDNVVLQHGNPAIMSITFDDGMLTDRKLCVPPFRVVCRNVIEQPKFSSRIYMWKSKRH